jgi:hypothetical protein
VLDWAEAVLLAQPAMMTRIKRDETAMVSREFLFIRLNFSFQMDDNPKIASSCAEIVQAT